MKEYRSYLTPEEIRDRFNREAETYVEEVTDTIPDYYSALSTMTSLVSQLPERPLRILDLGCGPGFVAKSVAEGIQGGTEITLVDFADKILAKAKCLLDGIAVNVSAICVDFRDLEYGDGVYHAVISSLALHHLRPGEKSVIYPRIFRSVKPGGLFLNYDQFVEPEWEWERLLRNDWARFILGVGWTEIQIQKMFSEIFEGEDSPETVDNEFLLLRSAGFDSVSLLLRKHLFGLIAAKKKG